MTPLKNANSPRPRILVVDDDPGILTAIANLLEAEGCEVLSAANPMEAIGLFRQGEVAVVFSDQTMPGMSGIELLTLIRQQSPTTVCVMITGVTNIKLAEEVINQRLAHFFVSKPWEPGRIQQIVHDALELRTRLQRDPGAAFSEAGRLKVHEHASRAAFSLARAVDARDSYTHSHSARVSAWGQLLGKRLGLMGPTLEELRIGGLLHDLGKIGIPDEVLLKPGRLTDEEFRYIRMHPIIGVTITEPIDFPWGIVAIVRQHHENHNGSGYPTGIGGEDISLPARIIHVIDAFEAMSADRVYRMAKPRDWIVAEFDRCRGSQFDPQVTEVFMELLAQGAFDQPLDQHP